MMDVWSWITHLPDPGDWPEASDAALAFEVASSPAKSIVLKAERTSGSASEALVTFSVCLEGFHPSNSTKTLWVSNPCPLPADGRPDFHPLVLQLVQEVIARAPSSDSAAGSPRLDLRHLFAPGCAAASQFPNFFELVFLCRLFWLCACDSPADVGYLYFQAMNSALERALDCRKAIRDFLMSVGADWEIYFMRSLGYMLAKWCMLGELSPSGSGAARRGFGSFSYATESHGLWILRGYVPVLAMDQTHHHGHQGHPGGYAALEANESLLRYALAHQQLEVVLQLEYSVGSREGDRFIRVGVRVDNLRLHVARLGFAKRDPPQGGEGEEAHAAADERHFPSRVRVWVGPELGSAGVSCLSLGRSTENPEREVESEQTVKGGFGESKLLRVRATARTKARSRARSWRWEQEAEGNLAVFEGLLCDPATGAEVATWTPNKGAAGKGPDPRGGMRRRYLGPGRAFSKAGGLVLAGDAYGEWASWRVGREMEGKVLRWRVGGKVWVSYWPNELKTPYMETRCVEWRDEIELPITVG